MTKVFFDVKDVTNVAKLIQAFAELITDADVDCWRVVVDHQEELRVEMGDIDDLQQQIESLDKALCTLVDRVDKIVDGSHEASQDAMLKEDSDSPCEGTYLRNE